jgi:hypothetical protein
MHLNPIYIHLSSFIYNLCRIKCWCGAARPEILRHRNETFCRKKIHWDDKRLPLLPAMCSKMRSTSSNLATSPLSLCMNYVVSLQHHLPWLRTCNAKLQLDAIRALEEDYGIMQGPRLEPGEPSLLYSTTAKSKTAQNYSLHVSTLCSCGGLADYIRNLHRHT